MIKKLTIASAALVAVSLGAAFTSVDTPAETQIVPPAVMLDFSEYSTAPELAKAHPGDSCTVMNPGTPFCYMMCERPPRLRTCDDI